MKFSWDLVEGHMFDYGAPCVVIRKKRKINRASLKQQAVRAQPWLNYSFSSICFNWKEKKKCSGVNEEISSSVTVLTSDGALKTCFTLLL